MWHVYIVLIYELLDCSDQLYTFI